MNKRDDYYKFYFGRNFGILTEAQIEKIRNARIAIAGLGGSGGYSLINLVHMGFEKFVVADLDSYEEHNKNRQPAAYRQNIGRPKVDSLVEVVKNLNPYIEIKTFNDGVTAENAEEFTEDVDFIIETMDFNVPGAKFALHDAAKMAGVYISTSPSPTFGAPCYTFGPETPSFKEVFGLDKLESFDKKNAFRFIEKLVIPNLQDYPEEDKKRILNHCYEASIGNTHLSTNIMGVTSSAQLLCMAALETVLFGKPAVLAPKITVLDHYTMQYKIVDMTTINWENR